MAAIDERTATGVSFALTEEQKELRALAREFAEKEIRPREAECDEHMRHPVDVIEKAHEVGLMSLHVPRSSVGRASPRSRGCSSARSSIGAAPASARRSRRTASAPAR